MMISLVGEIEDESTKTTLHLVPQGVVSCHDGCKMCSLRVLQHARIEAKAREEYTPVQDA